MSTGKAVLIGILSFLAVIVVIVAVYVATVALSGPKGQGDAIIKKNSAENWTKAQSDFEQIYADVQATQQKIQNADQAAKADPNNKTKGQTLQGLQSYCASEVANYNAKSRSFLTQDFKSADLPYKLDLELCNTTAE